MMLQTFRNINKLAIVALVASASVFSYSCTKRVDVDQVAQPTGVVEVSPHAGPKNTLLSISGANFPDKSGIQVKVNGKAATIVAATSNNIQVTVPQGAGTGNIEVTFGGTTYNGGTFTYQNTYTVSALTNGQEGLVNGPLASAKFQDIESIAIDQNNNMYVADYYGDHTVRKINLATGTVSTLATIGGGAEFLSTDAAGNVYVVDEDNNEIVKVTPAGAVSTIASPSFAIQGIKVGASGKIYVSGSTNIAAYSSTGTQLWRLRSHGSGNVDGDTSAVKFSLYGNIEVDPTETKIYVINSTLSGAYPSQIKMLDLSTKKMTTIAGTTTGGYVDGAANEAEFSLIYGVALDKQGGLYIADLFNSAIRYLKNGQVSTVVGGLASGNVPGIGQAAKISGPQGVAFDSNGNLYIADYNNLTIYKVVID